VSDLAFVEIRQRSEREVMTQTAMTPIKRTGFILCSTDGGASG
jgi:hypothetical protein